MDTTRSQLGQPIWPTCPTCHASKFGVYTSLKTLHMWLDLNIKLSNMWTNHVKWLGGQHEKPYSHIMLEQNFYAFHLAYVQFIWSYGYTNPMYLIYGKYQLT